MLHRVRCLLLQTGIHFRLQNVWTEARCMTLHHWLQNSMHALSMALALGCCIAVLRARQVLLTRVPPDEVFF